MIEIICDQHELYSASESDSIVTETSQFEDELLRIKSYAESGGDSLRIIVRNPVLFKWFDAAIKYGARKQIIDPVALLADGLEQVTVPKYLRANPRWIVELGLLDTVKKHPANGEPIEDWLRMVLLGEVWGKTAPDSPEELTDVFTYLLGHEKKALHPLEKYLLEKRLRYWSNSNPDKTGLFPWLKRKPFKRAQYIAWEQLLFLFPEDKVSAWLQQDNIWYELSLFPNRHKLPRLSLSAQLPEKIAAFVRAFLAQKWDASSEEAMSFISGELELEKKFLLEHLNHQLQNEIALNSAVYEKIIELKKFSEVVALARQLIPAKEPAKLPVDTSIDMVQDWVANEYLPFYNSCSLLGQVEATEPYVFEFEKWLEQHYTNMLFGVGMAYSQVSKIRERVLNGEPVLIVVFDGLDYLCAHDELLPAMQGHGFFPIDDLHPSFAFLPTQTYIAKPALVAGKMKSQIPDEIPTASFYKKLLQGYLGIEQGAIRAKTDKDGSLLELIQEPALAYLYLDNYLDRELLHSNIRQHIRKKKYGEYARNQASMIARCLNDFREMYGKSLSVIICSDHGYTVIPKNAAIVKVSVAKKGKVRTLFTHEIENTDDLDLEKIWNLNANLFGLNDEMVLPHGYSCFNKRPQGATHGGCSPQEMAVPWFLFSENKPAPLKPLSFSIEGEIFRKRDHNSLRVKISNPNGYLVKILGLDITGLEMLSNLPLTIGQNGVGEFCSNFNASAVSDSLIELSVRYRLQSQAGKMDKKIILKVPTTGAMSTEFDDDFEF